MARCQHGLCSDIFNRPLPNIQIDRHLAPTESFLLLSLLIMSGTCMQKNCQQYRSGRHLSNCFCRWRNYEWLEGKQGWQFSATETNSEKTPSGGGARGRIRDSPKLARLCFHFRPINIGKRGEVLTVVIAIEVALIDLFIRVRKFLFYTIIRSG